MNQQEFTAISAELLAQWGPGSYTPAQFSILFQIVKPLTVHEVKRSLDELLVTHTRQPSIAQIKGACLPALHRHEDAERQKRLKNSRTHTCVSCGGCGWATIYRDDDPTSQVSVICTCEAARAIGIQAGLSRVSPQAIGESRYWTSDLADRGWHKLDHTSEALGRYCEAVRTWQESRSIQRQTICSSPQELIRQAMQGAREASP